MAKSKKLFFNIPKPCTEDWNEMKSVQGQHFCLNCQKNVIDFTTLSDTELFNYINKNPHTCGRFYSDQLNRTISPITHKPLLGRKFSKFAAAVITFFSLKNANAESIKNTALSNIYSVPAKDAHKILTDSAIISGKVVDENGDPLDDVKIYWEGESIAETDSSGMFEFSPKITNSSKSYVIGFLYPGLVKTVRNYHSAMGSTNYSIVMSAPSFYREIIMGGIMPLDEFEVDLPPLQFNYNSSELTVDNKMILSTVATMLRNHPGLVIELSGSGKDGREIKKMKAMQVALKNWLFNNEGISERRINLKTVPYNPAMRNIIEIKNCTKD